MVLAPPSQRLLLLVVVGAAATLLMVKAEALVVVLEVSHPPLGMETLHQPLPLKEIMAALREAQTLPVEEVEALVQ